MLAGRDRERAAVRHLLGQARGSRGSSLVLHGLPGVGKSTLLDTAAVDAQADGFAVLRTSGIESEAPLAFAALQRLLRPVLRLADRLPDPQARALRRAFGAEEGEGDRFVVFMARGAVDSGRSRSCSRVVGRRAGGGGPVRARAQGTCGLLAADGPGPYAVGFR